jgi:hypothetical protein
MVFRMCVRGGVVGRSAVQAPARRCPNKLSLTKHKGTAQLYAIQTKKVAEHHTRNLRSDLQGSSNTRTHNTRTTTTVILSAHHKPAASPACRSAPRRLQSIQGTGVEQARELSQQWLRYSQRSVAGSWKLGCCYGNQIVTDKDGDGRCSSTRNKTKGHRNTENCTNEFQ